MNRRELLAAGGAVTIAGCLSSDSEDEPAREDDSPVNEEPEPTVDVTVTEPTLETRELSGGRVETAATGLVENTGDARLGLVSVAAKFYNSDGQLLSSSPWDIRDLVPGEVWEPWIAYIGEGEVAEAELAVTNATAHARTVAPYGMVLESSDIQIPVDDYAMPRVTGEVANETGGSVDYLEARPKLFAENGHLLETGITSTQQLSAGESWQFDVQVHFNNESWKDRIDDHAVVLTQ